jgi:hypothetical protein
MRKSAAVSLALGLIVCSAALSAAEVGGTERTEFQSIVTSQIEAFRSDDGVSAYDFASPMIRSLFPTADIFMEMVRTGYAPVYRPDSFSFGPVLESAGGPVQRVFLTGPDGANYVADYTFQQQPDGSWKINGVTLRKDDSPTI